MLYVLYVAKDYGAGDELITYGSLMKVKMKMESIKEYFISKGFEIKKESDRGFDAENSKMNCVWVRIHGFKRITYL